MADLTVLTNLHQALRVATLPSVTQWNRVEGRPRSQLFDRALRAEVRDGLWMLARQWQVGEFRADDAGAPVLAQMRMDHTRLTRAKLGEDPVEPMLDPLPLEARVERLQPPLVRGGRKIALDLRLLLGRHWLKSIASIGDYADEYRDAYPIEPPDPTSEDDADVCAHPAAFSMLSALAGRAMDGGELYLHLETPGAHAWDDVAVDDADKDALDDAGERFVRWFERLISQPQAGQDGAWTPDRLEYQFDCSAPLGDDEAKVYTATEYASGGLDWWALDVDASRSALEDGLGPDDETVIGFEMRTVIPSPLQFDGMPNARWWAFEDGRVNFGAVSAATTDLAKLLFLEFALVYSNDWFIVPFTAPAGTVATLTGCAVTNTFGERFWIVPAASGLDDDPRRFTLFTSSVVGDARLPADTSLLLLPTASGVIDGPSVEEVLFLRDEMANMVWGVEKVIPLPDGSAMPGLEAARETLAYFERLIGGAAGGGAGGDPPSAADIRYRVMNTVPENWIPFIPARIPGSEREVRLQRAAMPRVIENDPDDPKRIEPMTMLLRDGLDRTPRDAYFLQEAEVSREGTYVKKHYQRTRWQDGRVVVWLGVRKQPGRGEGASGLGFDRIVPTPRDE